MASYTLGSAVSRSIACSNLTDSEEDVKESGRRESEKYAKRGAVREKGKRKGERASAALPFPSFLPFYFHFCTFAVLSSLVNMSCDVMW